MPEYVWRAANARGQMVEGRLTADTESAAMRQLRERGLTPLLIDDIGVASAQAVASTAALAGVPPVTRQARTAKGPANQKDVLALTSELAIMLRAGLALDSALRVLIDMSHKPAVSTLLAQVMDDVKGGTPLSKALMRQRSLFGDFYINMVRSGEASGQLSAVLTRLVEHMERLRTLRDSVISASIYPAILLAVAVLSLIGMLGFVVPQFEKLFTDMGDALPLPTRIIMALGKGFGQYGLAVGIALAAGGWLLARWLRSEKGQIWWQNKALRLPLLGSLLLKYELTLFSRSLGTLLGNGVPMLAALNIATETVGNTVLRQALVRVAPMVKDGGKVVAAIAATQIFEPIAINLIRVGEETGRIGHMMLELANILNRDVENGIKRALTLVEPIMIMVLGVLIAGIIVSILLGILSINDLAG